MRSVKKNHQKIIGIIYDFDGTLSPNNMQEDTIFPAYGIDKNEMWAKADYLVRKMGYERTLAYLKLFIHDEAFSHKPIQKEKLKSLAKEICYFEGVKDFFKNIDEWLSKIPEVAEWGIQIEHYVISSGMQSILEGTDIYPYFKRTYACEYEYDELGHPVFPKLVINDTNKTQFLFRINKGKLDLNEDINSHMSESDRRIPFRNMIYLGDSVTDIPAMTVVQRFGGHAIAVFNPACRVGDKVKQLVSSGRVDHFVPADYRKESLLFKVLQNVLKKIVHHIVYQGSVEMSREWVQNNPIEE